MNTHLSNVFALSLLSLSSWSFAQNIEAPFFQKDEWEIQCSNIGTCRAAGYQLDGALPASILMTRLAGANQPIRIELTLSNHTSDLSVDAKDPIHFYLNSQDQGIVQTKNSGVAVTGQLNSKQVQALQNLLKQKVQIEFKNKKYHWLVSDLGMTATLLKMDDVQKRVGTTGALIRKGTNSEAMVLQPDPKIVVKKVKTSAEPYSTLKPQSVQYKALLPLLMAAKPKVTDPDEDACQGVYESEIDGYRFGHIELYKLSNQKVLATTVCWRGAYNEGYGAWVNNQSLKGKAQFVTDSMTDVESGELFAVHKGRGIGDCWSRAQWVWNGHQFIQTSDSWSGACKGVAGGMWDLEKIESIIK